MNASRPLLDPYHHAGYALDLAHVVLGFREGGQSAQAKLLTRVARTSIEG